MLGAWLFAISSKQQIDPVADNPIERPRKIPRLLARVDWLFSYGAGPVFGGKVGASICRDALFMAAVTIPRPVPSSGFGRVDRTLFSAPGFRRLSSFGQRSIARFRPAGRPTFFACAKKARQRNTPRHPGLAALDSPPSGAAPGAAYTSHPWPVMPLAASMRLVPLRNTSTRPTDGEFARMWVSRFRPLGVVGMPRRRAGATRAAASRGFHPPYSMVPTRNMGTIKTTRHRHRMGATPKDRAGIGSRQEAEWNRCVRA
jgi:hypothetical protein